jgi:hypothetical protein
MSGRHAALAVSLFAALACDEKPKLGPAPAETTAQAPTPSPVPAKPTLPPTIIVDSSGALVAGARVALEGAGSADRLKAELEEHRSFLEQKEVRLAAERKVKPSYVEAMLAGLEGVGATRVLIRTSSRANFPNEVGFLPPGRARSAPACSVISMVLEDRSTATWHLNGGVAGRRGKGMAGPDLTLTGETIRQQAKSCKESNVLFVAGAEGVEWGLVYDLGASSKTFAQAYFADVALVSTPPVPGRPVELGK